MKPRKRLLWLILSISGLVLVVSLFYFNFNNQPQETETFDPSLANCSLPVDAKWIAKVNRIKWVTYSSPNPNTGPGFYQPSPETIRNDLLTLKKAGFTGLVSYSSIGVMGKDFPSIAQEVGFKGVIMGIWDPTNESELDNAKYASSLPVILGYTIGNEGLYRSRDRYTLSELCYAISDLRASTSRPATTSEQSDDFDDHPQLYLVGDWLFPNAHPYWHATKYAENAVQWEVGKYREFTEESGRFVFFKEVGLPTRGAFGLSETNHDLYYRGLEKTDVHFVYFEGFDQPSKDHNSVEPHWGIFRSDQSPKLLAWNLMGVRPFTSSGPYDGWILECTESSNEGCSLDKTGDRLVVGDDAQDRQYRSILSFNTSGLPDDAVITSVNLKIKTSNITGNNPFIKLGTLKVDSCTPHIGVALVVQVSDFQFDIDCDTVGVFESKPNSGWYTAELDPATINLQGMTQFRLRFQKGCNDNKTADAIEFYSGNSANEVRPNLVVYYEIP